MIIAVSEGIDLLAQSLFFMTFWYDSLLLSRFFFFTNVGLYKSNLPYLKKT